MRRLLALILLFSSCFAFGQTAMFSSSVTLGDGEMCIMPTYDEHNPCEEQERAIASTYYERLMDNTLLRALGLNKFDSTLASNIRESVVGQYDSYYIRDHYTIDWYLGDFIIKIAKNERVRKILADTVIDLICDLCKYYPKDYKEAVLNKVKETQQFVDNMVKHTYESRDGELYIDGVAAPDDAYGIKGFIIRRVIAYDMPIDDFANTLDRLYTRVDAVDVSSNKDILRSVYINKDITYNTTANGNYYYINKTGEAIVPFFMDSIYRRRCRVSVIHYFVGEDVAFYKIQNTYARWDYDKDKYVYYPDDGLIIIDNNGELIYEEGKDDDDYYEGEYDEEDY